MPDIADLYRKLREDARRDQLGFSEDMRAANSDLLSAASDDESAEILSKWLQRYQPCLFGRIVAKMGGIHYCILTENDVLSGDEAVKRKIQASRLNWLRAGYNGSKSAFVILAVSPELTAAAPDIDLRNFAQRLCSLYLLDENLTTDVIYTDEIYLEKPGEERVTWKWLVGVNFFAAAADGRWWQDHRIPGGIGFSMNSVGHLVKSGLLTKGIQQLDETLGIQPEPLAVTNIDSLEKALEFAMRTISKASDAISGKATELLPLVDPNILPVTSCPAKLPHILEDKNYCFYQGYYHTDITLPSDYFTPEIRRPERIKPVSLDFTYLFHDHIDNPAYVTTGQGRRVRTQGEGAGPNSNKLAKSEPKLVSINSSQLLTASLAE